MRTLLPILARRGELCFKIMYKKTWKWKASELALEGYSLKKIAEKLKTDIATARNLVREVTNAPSYTGYRFYRESKCRSCGVSEIDCPKTLHVHHLDKNHSNNNPKNLATLCFKCHELIHKNQLF